MEINVMKEIETKQKEFQNDEISFYKWLWNYVLENEILLFELNKSWMLPQSRYSIWFKDVKLEFFDLINKNFKRIEDDVFLKHCSKCKETINPKNGTLFIINQGLFKNTNVYYYEK